MKFYLERRKKSDLYIGLCYTFIGGVGFILSYFVDSLPRLIPPCIFHSVTGIPCPACGGTRTGILLSHFKILDAATLNPLFFILFIALAVWGINTIIGMVTGKNIVITISNSERRLLRWMIIFIIPLNWLYLILTD